MAYREIEIHRNFIERTLMFIKDYVKKNMKVFLYSFISIIALIIIFVAGIIIYDNRAFEELEKFESIIENYNNKRDAEPDKAKDLLPTTVKELETLIDSSYWGFVNKNGYYIIGGLYFDEKMYKQAEEYYMKFVEAEPSSFFAPLALMQTAVAEEGMGNFDKALSIYQRLETEYNESIIADEIYYNLGRIFSKKGDIFKAREYYNKVISLYPQSISSEKAKKSIFLLGYKLKK